MKSTEKVVIKKGCHSRGMLSGIFLIPSRCSDLIKSNALYHNNREAGDPRQKHSGMIPDWITSHGFTLIELLVVVLIIGILAAVAVPQYQVAVTKSRFATLKNMAKALADAQEVYYLANGSYTTKFANLDIDAGGIPEDDTDNKRIFDWGTCYVDTRSVMCTSRNGGSSKMSYQLYYIYSTDPLVGKKRCVAWNDDKNSIQNKVCKQETKDEQPIVIEGVRIGWVYAD